MTDITSLTRREVLKSARDFGLGALCTMFVAPYIKGALSNNVKSDPQSLHRQNLTHYMNGNLDSFMNNFNETYFDGGSQKYYSKSAFKKAAERRFKQNQNLFKGLDIEDIIDPTKTRILTYDEMKVTRAQKFFERGKFKLQQGDILVSYQPKKDSKLPDEFTCVYRKVGKNYKIVAGD